MKNLASNQLNLSTFKGEGELSSINLDEKALEEVIELPTWLKIQKATCGRLFIKVEEKRIFHSIFFWIELDSLDEFKNITDTNSKRKEGEEWSLNVL